MNGSASEFGEIESVRVAEESSAADIVAWQEGRDRDLGVDLAGQSPYRAHDPDAKFTVCVYAASAVVTPRPPGAPEPDQIIVIIDEKGGAKLDSAGPRTAMRSATPSEFLAAADAGDEPAVPQTSQSQGSDWTGPTITVASGKTADGRSWQVDARPTTVGFCYGVGYNTPALAACVETSILGNEVVYTIVTEEPALVLGLVREDVERVRLEFVSGSVLEIDTKPNPDGFPEGGYFAEVVSPGSQVDTYRAYDASQNELER